MHCNVKGIFRSCGCYRHYAWCSDDGIVTLFTKLCLSHETTTGGSWLVSKKPYAMKLNTSSRIIDSKSVLDAYIERTEIEEQSTRHNWEKDVYDDYVLHWLYIALVIYCCKLILFNSYHIQAIGQSCFLRTCAKLPHRISYFTTEMGVSMSWACTFGVTIIYLGFVGLTEGSLVANGVNVCSRSQR